jgi:hypothetical protein
MLVRQRKRRRDEAFHYARAYLDVQRLPAGVPSLLREWANRLTDDEIRWGADARSLAANLQPYRRPWLGL